MTTCGDLCEDDRPLPATLTGTFTGMQACSTIPNGTPFTLTFSTADQWWRGTVMTGGGDTITVYLICTSLFSTYLVVSVRIGAGEDAFFGSTATNVPSSCDPFAMSVTTWNAETTWLALCGISTPAGTLAVTE